MSIKLIDENTNRTLINIFKKLENIDFEISNLNTEIYKHVSLFEDPEDSKEPIVKDSLKKKEIYIKEYNSLIYEAKNLVNTEPKVISLKCDYFINNFSNTQDSLDYINGKLKDETILDGTKELFTSLAYNCTVESYSPFNVHYVAYKIPEIFGQEVTVNYDQVLDLEESIDYKEVSNELAKKIIETGEALGKFYTFEKGIYVGIDNSAGHVWVEDFKTEEECLSWLHDDQELEDENELEI
ncbi:hypothetical protein [Sporanaerobacter acetigenes]|uniref:Uncharacterized protein n=1 Tax=Sporanaerobacter acetigenes DSM 13106 TaxID=1123281 RepID=A0A1M5UB73_9FIRM|nr:hypothetical protein [Sporanaerobacter acetigenes]SHH60158.1 hypothetical protein SAMN02745180_00582 [Sporanaerobacter acetigenes DSM 13106]